MRGENALVLLAAASLVVDTGSRAPGLQALRLPGSRVQAQELQHAGRGVPRHVGSSRVRVEPMSPTLAGGSHMTEPPGKPLGLFIFTEVLTHNIMSVSLVKHDSTFTYMRR